MNTHMQVEEMSEFFENTNSELFPTYRVDFWTLESELTMFRVTGAADLQEVDAWARARHPRRYTIYCEIVLSENEAFYARVSGYEMGMGSGQPVSHFVSNTADAASIQAYLDQWSDAPSLR